jgi:type I restriction enzyme S subunit
MRNISHNVIKAIPVRLPPLTEQRRIAASLQAQLAEVNTARQAAQAQVRDAAALRTAIYRDSFRGIVPVAVPPAFDSAPSGWKWQKLSDIAQLESGHTPSRQRPDWWGGDVSWISLTEIRALDGRWVEGTQLRTNAEGIANSSARILPRGTVCYSRTASVGFVCIMAAPMATSQDFANWLCGDSLDPEFLMHALIRARKELREIATGATHKTIYMPQLESFQLCAPPIDEQRRIVARLQSRLVEADAIARAAAAQLAEIEQLPHRLLAQAFALQTERSDPRRGKLSTESCA